MNIVKSNSTGAVKNKLTYETKIVAFLDILGFKNAVRNGKLEDIFFVLDVNNGQLEFQQQLRDRYKGDKNINVQVFSDSVYLSYPAERGWDLVFDVADLMIHMSKYGFYFRGGITYGEVFDDDRILFGPAVIEAYEIESQVAVYPRVVISQNAVNELQQTGNAGDFERYTRQDVDGCYYVNFLMRDRKIYLNVAKIRNSLVRNYKNAKKRKSDLKTFGKLTWLINYFNSVVDDINEERREMKEKVDPQIEKIFGSYESDLMPIGM